MSLLLLYWGIMIACYAVASKLRHKKETFRFTEQLTNIVIYILVFLMGLRMGANEEVISNLGSIGLQAAGITVFVVGGSILAVHIARKALKLNKEGIFGLPEEEEQVGEEEREAESGGVKFTLIILTFVVAGMAAGYFMIPEIFEDTDAFQDMSGDWLVVGICILLALAGFNLGLEGKVIQSFKGVGIKVIFIPIAAVAGSLIMGAVYGLISSLTVSESIAVSAGFGWYTLAPGMLTEAGFAVGGRRIVYAQCDKRDSGDSTHTDSRQEDRLSGMYIYTWSSCYGCMPFYSGKILQSRNGSLFVLHGSSDVRLRSVVVTLAIG